MSPVARVDVLVEELAAAEVYRRMHARHELSAMGAAATPALLVALAKGTDRHRWEICKTLVAIRDPRAAPALVERLRDEVMAVRWVAAEALIVLGMPAIRPLLHALEEHFDSVFLRESAHHVLWGLNRLEVLAPEIKVVLRKLSGSQPGIDIAVAARRALARHTEHVQSQ